MRDLPVTPHPQASRGWNGAARDSRQLTGSGRRIIERGETYESRRQRSGVRMSASQQSNLG